MKITALLILKVTADRSDLVREFTKPDKPQSIWSESSPSPISPSLSPARHKAIDGVLARGEKLDSLVEKSFDRSAASQETVSLVRGLNRRRASLSMVETRLVSRVQIWCTCGLVTISPCVN